MPQSVLKYVRVKLRPATRNLSGSLSDSEKLRIAAVKNLMKRSLVWRPLGNRAQ
jgi:hypothetical protein